MITIKDFMEVARYRITEGSKFQWACFGPNAYVLSCDVDATDDAGDYSLCLTFDTMDSTVYVAELFDYARNNSYRLLNPDFKDAFFKECDERSVPNDQAYDDTAFVDLDEDEDFMEKARAVVAGEDYDLRVQIPVNLPNETILILMKEAHRRDITFNALMTEILEYAIENAKKGTV